MLRCVLRPPQLAASLFWSALQRRSPLLALGGHAPVALHMSAFVGKADMTFA